MCIEVSDALEAWNKAPAHIRMMAGAYVGPLLVALVAVSSKVEKIDGQVSILSELAKLKGVNHGA